MMGMADYGFAVNRQMTSGEDHQLVVGILF
jgi:hypothetical protein